MSWSKKHASPFFKERSEDSSFSIEDWLDFYTKPHEKRIRRLLDHADSDVNATWEDDEDHLQKSSLLIHNSSFLMQKSSFLMQKSSFLMQKSSFKMQKSSF